MTSSLGSEINWISLEELQEPKWCSQCHQQLSVKQINCTDACRTCFNVECSSTADIEYIRRSYRQMELETSEVHDVSDPLGASDEEMQRVNQFLNQVENLVAHRLSEELKNELKSCNNQLEVLKSASMKKLVDCDESEKLCNDFSTDLSLSQSFCTNFQPQPSTTSSCFSSQFVGPMSQFQENAATWYQGTLGSQSETCDNLDNLISSQDISPVSDPFDLNGKVSSLYPSAYDNAPDNTWQCDDDFLPNNSGSESLDIKPDNGNINSKEPSDGPASSLDSKASLPLSNDELILPGGCLNSESNVDESGKEKLSENISMIPPKLGDPRCSAVPSDRGQQDFSKDNEATVEKLQNDRDFDLSLKKTSSFRCYPPSRGRGRQRALVQGTPTTIPVGDNLLIDTDCVTSELGSSNPFSVDESSKESDVQLFPTPSASPDSCQSLPEPFEQLNHPSSQSEGNFCVDVEKLTQKPRPLLNQVQLGDEGEEIVNCTLSDSIIKTERVVSAPKKNPNRRAAAAKTASVTKIETSLVKGAGSKAGLGFSELKQFGGAKCSALAEGRTRGGRHVGKGRRKVKSEEKVASNAVHDDIEQAIANIQQSSESQPSSWNTLLSDILP